MKDLEIIHEILFDEIYKGDQLIFELTLNKIEDQKLKLGFLFELYAKPGYESDKSDIIEMIRLQSIEDVLNNSNLIIEYQKYFQETFKPLLQKNIESGPSVEELQSCMDFIHKFEKWEEGVIWNENPEIVNELKSLSPKAQAYLKEILIKHEQYKEVVYLDKCLAL